jgi:hypothetical protein
MGDNRQTAILRNSDSYGSWTYVITLHSSELWENGEKNTSGNKSRLFNTDVYIESKYTM